MLVLAPDEPQRIASPYFSELVAVVNAAWADWMSSGYPAQMQHKRFRAAFVWNQLLTHAKRRFDGRQDVRVEVIKNWEGLLLHDSIFIRFKLGYDDLLSRNYPTQSALDFHDQELDLFGSGITRLELIYVLNDLGTEIQRIALIQRHKNSVAWAIDLLGKEDETQKVIDLPAVVRQGSPAERIIKPKSGNQNERLEPNSGS
ncbi:hypothetical protein [Eleftheria terrae]|uniref:hypothetical protein n=1 Tax=Eleftheria terrae TaxID=1597781 RepID=UPI00263B23BD|nr:hypothetical protein [Eleftheria terrae]WKB54336.1 hypothetical protein N7L95_08100 [Eleftheria terrae]